MAPIRLGDGTGIDSVRLGDGTGIDEVRTGDGQTVFTATPVLHGFEDQSLADYTDFNTNLSINTTNPLTGSASLDLESFGGGLSTATSATGLDRYPKQGDKWAVRFGLNGNTSTRGNFTAIFQFGGDGTNGPTGPRGPTIVLDRNNNADYGTGLFLTDNDSGFNGPSTVLASKSFTIPNLTDTYRFEIHWKTNDDIRVVCVNETQNQQEADITESTTNYTDGGSISYCIGYNFNVHRFDNAPVSVV